MPVVVIEHSSSALKGNLLGDPSTRKLHVIVPEKMPTGPIPCVWYLAGYAGVGRAMLSDDPWQEGLEERLLRLQSEGRIGPMMVALPDAFTRLGGSQYLSSPVVGDYETYLLEELPAVVESRFTIGRHGIAGKSSGGFAAIVHAMRHGDRFDAVVCHSGDMGFEMSLFADIPRLMDAVRDHGSVEALVDAHRKAIKKKDSRWFGPMSMLALASVYSPREDAPLGIELPFDLERGALKPEVLKRWLAWDPVRLVDNEACQEALRKMRLVFVDCGSRDEHFLHWGALAFHRKLEDAGIEHVYETFGDGHRGTGYRLDRSLPLLYEALVD